MAPLTKFLAALRVRLLGNRSESDLSAELQFHLECKIDENLRAGMSPAEARCQALLTFGGVDPIKEACRDQWAFRWIEDLAKDLRYGIRLLLKAPGFTVVAILTLALGTGATTAIFCVVNAVILRPLPYREPDRIVKLTMTNLPKGINDASVSWLDFCDLQQQSHSFEHLALLAPGLTILSTPEGSERILGAGVTDKFFDVLGVPPLLGRTFLPGEEKQNGPHRLVIGYSLWQRQFGSDPDILGKTVTLMKSPRQVIGVMPPGFSFPEGSEAWFLGVNHDPSRDGRSFFAAVGRLKSSVPLEQAQMEIRTIAQQLAQHYPDTNQGWSVAITSLQELAVRGIRPALLILMGATGMVLLICCTNVASLLLARGLARQREITIRLALGANKRRTMRQLLTESFLLAGLGGIAGLALAYSGVRILVALAPAILPRIAETNVDLRVLGFTLLLSVVSCLLSGGLPSWQAARTDPNEALKEGSKGATRSLPHRRLGSVLVISELALSLVLLIGAGLLLESFWRVQRTNLGFNPENLLTLRVSLATLPDPQWSPFLQEVMARLQTLPGVKSVGGTTSLPLRGGGLNRAFVVEGRPLVPEQEDYAAYFQVSPGYLRTMGIRILSGRPFSDRDKQDSPGVAIVNETLVRRFWPEGNALGRKVTLWRDQKTPREIVGIVRDVRSESREAPPEPQIYVPYVQDPMPACSLVIRTVTDPMSLANTVRRVVKSVDAYPPIYEVRTMEQIASGTIAERHFYLVLLGSFAILALILAAVGIYGVLAYTVSQRTHEIGIRMAVGASTGDVFRSVMHQTTLLIVLGLGAGLPMAFALTRSLASLLFGVSARDPVVFTGATLIAVAAGLIASYLPARRAARVDPMMALRYE